jgi:hypothetical protein
MTRADIIFSTFQEPVRTWIIDNVKLEREPEWLNDEGDGFGKRDGVVRAYVVLDYSFNWSRSKEGHPFWKEIFNKIKNENR